MHDGVERISSSRTHSGTSPPLQSEMKTSEFAGRIVAEVLMISTSRRGKSIGDTGVVMRP
jgi:hypothetical protein